MAAPSPNANTAFNAHARDDTLVNTPVSDSPMASTFLPSPPLREPSLAGSAPNGLNGNGTGPERWGVDLHLLPPEEKDENGFPKVVPPVVPGRTLVLCFDGTGDQFDLDNSNIVQFFTLLKKDNKAQQLVYYQAGIGTYTSPTMGTPFASAISKTLDEMVAWNLHSHVMSGYEFLMQNYNKGDRICIFGFSRGAYTARSLAGMIHKVGVLPKCNHQQVPFAYKMYTQDDDLGWSQSKAFKKAFSIEVEIEFVGVWDTVDSVGLIPKTLPFASSNTIVNTFRHAISLDERRAKFKANTWKTDDDKDDKDDKATAEPAATTMDSPVLASPAHTQAQAQDQAKAKSNPAKPPPPQHANTAPLPAPQLYERSDSLLNYASKVAHYASDSMGYGDDHVHADGSTYTNGKNGKSKVEEPQWVKDRKKQRVFEKSYSDGKGRNVPTDVDEVWFAGCHCDVGGGSVPNDTPNSLARIPLRWMIRQCFERKSGIMFESEGLRELGMEPEALWPNVKQRPKAKDETGTNMASMNLLPIPPKEKKTKADKDKAKDAAAAKTSMESSLRNFSGAEVSVSHPAEISKPRISEEEHELHDSLQPIYDQLSLAHWWWFLEILPIKQSVYHHQHASWFSLEAWASYFGLNLGRARHIPHKNSKGKEWDGKVRIHRSVRMRMAAKGVDKGKGREGAKYVPRAWAKILEAKADRTIEWVD